MYEMIRMPTKIEKWSDKDILEKASTFQGLDSSKASRKKNWFVAKFPYIYSVQKVKKGGHRKKATEIIILSYDPRKVKA